jgi:hypothetical protein
MDPRDDADDPPGEDLFADTPVEPLRRPRRDDPASHRGAGDAPARPAADPAADAAPAPPGAQAADAPSDEGPSGPPREPSPWALACWQSLRNLRVWMPFLLNPHERKRLATFPSKGFRRGHTWTIDLPRMCWRCGAEDGLEQRTWHGEVRAFEYPLEVIGFTLAGVLSFVLLNRCLTPLVALALCVVAVALGATIFWAKSWREQVELTMCTCADDAADARPPHYALFDSELYVFLPTARLKKALERKERERQGFDPPPWEPGKY